MDVKDEKGPPYAAGVHTNVCIVTPSFTQKAPTVLLHQGPSPTVRHSQLDEMFKVCQMII